MKPNKSLPSCRCSLGTSVFLIVLGLLLIFILPFFIKYIVDSKLVLAPQAEIFEPWKTLPVLARTDFYFFNWTNPEDIYNKSVKPKFQEVGPYRFSQTTKNSNITWNDNGTVTFRHQKFWHYDEECGNIQDRITTLNPVALSATNLVRSWNYMVRKGLSLSLSTMQSTIAITHTVSQLLFEGYYDPMVKAAHSMPFLAGRLPTWDKVGWLYSRNGSVDYEGVFNMGTGKNSILGKLYSWNYWTQTPYHESTCGQVGGWHGEFYGANSGKDSIQVFSSDMCRALTFNYVGEKYVDGILGYKYEMNHMLDNGTNYPEYKCFCNGECVPSGMVNVSSCKYGSPSFASLPHFCNADPYYINAVEGIDPPEKDKHEFSVTLEPNTGMPLEVQARLQANLLLQPVPSVSIYEDVPRVFFPIFWSEQKVQIPYKEASKLKLLLKVPIICTSMGILCISIGLILLSHIFYKRYRTKSIVLKL